MKIAHWTRFGPRQCGLYETTKDLIKAERLVGIDSQMINCDVKDNKPIGGDIKTDDWITTVSYELAKEADINVVHSFIPKEYRYTKPNVHILHGRPEASFMLGYTGEIKGLHHHFENLATNNQVDAFITLWPEYEYSLSLLFPKKKLYCVPAPLDLDAYQIKGPKWDLGDKSGNPNILVADIWREDVTPFNVIFAVAKFIQEKCPAGKLHIVGINRPQHGAIHWILNALEKAGVLGVWYGQSKKIKEMYRACDILVTPHIIATRVIREATAMGLKIVAGTGCKHSAFTANPMNIDAMADAIKNAWQENITKDNIRQYAADKFSLEKTGQEIKKVYEEVLYKRALNMFNGTPKKILFDIGGHLGETVKKFNKEVFDAKDWQIYSFEPLTYTKLQKILPNETNCKIISKGIATFTGKTKLFTGKINDGEGSTLITGKITGEVDYEHPVEIDVISLKDAIKEYVPVGSKLVIKMNIEGYEYDLMPYIFKEEIDEIVDTFFIALHSHKLKNTVEKNKISELFKRDAECKVVFYIKGQPNFTILNNYEDYVALQKAKKVGLWLKNYNKFYTKILNKHIPTIPIQQSKVLCLGARDGTEVLAFRNNGLITFGVDLNPLNKELVKEGDFHDLKNEIDSDYGIVYTNSLDHIFDVNKFLGEVKRVLIDGGYFVVLLAPADSVQKDKYATFKWNSWKEIEKLLNENGFSTVLIETIPQSKENNGWFWKWCIFRKEINETGVDL